MEIENVQNLQNALKATKELRSSVSRVFEILSDGMGNKIPSETREAEFLSEIRTSVLSVKDDFSELEKLATTTLHTSTPSLGNSGLLTLDSASDKSSLYHQLLHTYKWTNKLHQHSTLGHATLHANTLKRNSVMQLAGNKRPRRMAVNTAHLATPQHVDTLIQNLSRMFPDLKLVASRPIGSPTVLQVTCGRMLQTLIVLRGLIIEHVIVKALKEDIHTEEKQIDIWSPSRHQVFQKITDHATAATLHFYAPHMPELCFKSFLTWLNSYNNLFTSPCQKCGKHLLDGFPPTWRDFRTLQPFHDACRP